MSERLALRHYQSSKWEPLTIDVSSIVNWFTSIVERILTIKKWLYRLWKSKDTDIVSTQEISWIRNKILYEKWLLEHNNDKIVFLQNILNTKIFEVWENIDNIITKQLSSSQIRELNRQLSIDIDIHERALSPESKKIILSALEQKIGNRPDFVGPPKSVY